MKAFEILRNRRDRVYLAEQTERSQAETRVSILTGSFLPRGLPNRKGESLFPRGSSEKYLSVGFSGNPELLSSMDCSSNFVETSRINFQPQNSMVLSKSTEVEMDLNGTRPEDTF